jgi:hypothetical protein
MPSAEQPPRDVPPSSKAGHPDDAITRAAALLRDARPKLEKLVVRATPRAKLAGRAALRYVREHEGEIKQVAATFARARLRGPFRLAADALAGSASATPTPADVRCSACGTPNIASAKFCQECGGRLTPKP